MGSAGHEAATSIADAGNPQGRKIYKALKRLKSRASALAAFTLQWQDLEDHILSVHRQIDARIAQLQPHEQDAVVADSEEAQEDRVPVNGIVVAETVQSSPAGENLASSVPTKDGKSLFLYLVDQAKNQKVNHAGLHASLVQAENCGVLVLETMREYLRLRDGPNGEVPSDAGLMRRGCAILLDKFTKGDLELGEEVRGDARRFAVQWKEKLEKLEANLFIKFLQVYGLVHDFKEDEICKIFEDLIHRKEAPQTLRSLGFGHKAAGFIQKLISQNERIKAVNFVYDFNLVNQFSPISLIKDHMNWGKKEAAEVRGNGRNAEALVKAASLECRALSEAVNCIKVRNLGSEFHIGVLTKRINELRNHKSESKKPVLKSQSNTQPRKLSGSKRQSENLPAHPNQNENKGYPAVIPNGAAQVSPTGPPPNSLLTPQVADTRLAAARTAMDTSTDPQFGRNFVSLACPQHKQPYLPQGMDISRAADENGPIANINVHPQPPISTTEFQSSRVTSVAEVLPSIRNSSSADIVPPWPILSQYSDVPRHPSIDAFPGSGHRTLKGLLHENDGASSRYGLYRSAVPSALPPRKYSPIATYEDYLTTSIRSDLAAISAMKYEYAGSSSVRYAEESSSVSPAIPRTQQILPSRGYPAGRSYDGMSSQRQAPGYQLKSVNEFYSGNCK